MAKRLFPYDKSFKESKCRLTVKNRKERPMNKKRYSDTQILERLEEHMVTKLKSQYSVTKPTWRAIKKRMDQSKSFEAKVHSILALALDRWESIGIRALMKNDQNFNVNLYRMFAGNKKSFLSYEDSEIADRLDDLEAQS